jgi:hypothetical protein
MLTHYNDTDQRERTERDYNVLGIGSYYCTVITLVIKFEVFYVLDSMVAHCSVIYGLHYKGFAWTSHHQRLVSLVDCNSNLTLGGSSTYTNSVFFFFCPNLLLRHPFAIFLQSVG